MQSIHDMSAIYSLFTGDFCCFHTCIIADLAISVNRFVRKKQQLCVGF
jgi:hypothetical protein